MRLPPFYPILDVELIERRGFDLGQLATGLARLGIDLLQLRAKRLPAGEFLARAQRLRAVLPGETRLVINDRVDIALLSNAAGVHLGQDDLPPGEAVALRPRGALVGYSTHTVAQLKHILTLTPRPSYIALGPVFPTTSKLNPAPVIGLETLRGAREIYNGPLVAIGGITRESCAEVWRAGADSVAMISGWLAGDDPLATARDILDAAKKALGPGP